jgi:hypothetical protein
VNVFRFLMSYAILSVGVVETSSGGVNADIIFIA